MQLKTLLKHLDLTTLQLLLSIHQHGTLTRAARQEAIAVSAASKRLNELERALGERIFVRERTGMTLTLVGEILLLHAREMISSAQRINIELGEHGRCVPKAVRVAADLDAIIQFFPDDLSRFMELHPGIAIKLNEMPDDSVLQAVADGQAELGIITNPDGANHGVQLHEYRRDRLVLVVRNDHALARHARVPFADTLQADYVGLQRECWVSRQSQRAASAAGAALRLRVQVAGFDALCRIVHAGVGVGLAPYEVYRAIGEPLGLVAVELDDDWAALRLSIGVPHGRPMSVETAMLLEHLRRHARGVGPGAADTAARRSPFASWMPHQADAMLGALA